MTEELKAHASEEDLPAALKKLPDLKALREVRGLTIEEIFLKTRINAAILSAIENGDYEHLPAPLYAKKFIEIYAETIGVDAGVILAHYQRYLDQKQAVSDEGKAVEEQRTSERTPVQRYLLYSLPVLALIAAAFIWYTKEPRSTAPRVAVEKQQEATPTPAPVPAVKEPPPEATETLPTATPQIPQTTPQAPQALPPAVVPEEAPPTPGKAQMKLLIEAKEDTWLRITEDSKPPYQTTLKTGEKLSRTAREGFVVDIGNAAGVNVSFQGRSLGSLGEKGEVVHLRLPQQ